MLITTCASCAAPLALKDKLCCSRCKTRYCSAECQRAHWKRGGHKTLCEEIAERGGAEQYHGILKVISADEDAVLACAESLPKDAKCHICGQKNHPSAGGIGLVRGCSCRGTEGFAHLGCLFDIAHAAFRTQRSWTGWTTCRCCEQEFHGVVRCALGWACWGGYRNKPDDELRARAMTEVGIGLMEVGKYDEAFRVLEATVTFQRHLASVKINSSAQGLSREEFTNRLLTQGCLAMCCSKLGWQTDVVYVEGKKGRKGALVVLRTAFELAVENVPTTDIRHQLALGLAECLLAEHWVEGALRHLREETVLAEDALGSDHATTINFHFQLAQAVYKLHFFGHDGYRRLLAGSIEMHRAMHVDSARVLGFDHPLTRKIAASFLKCFDEQLDWSLDDIPSKYLAYRAGLLGD